MDNQEFRSAVANNLKDKFREHGFFLEEIIKTAKIIEAKCLRQDFPLNAEVDRLNYFYSAYMNTIQSLKDACQTATGAKISWIELSPAYGKFVRNSRNATTHDGKHLINAMKGTKNYIVGPLRRIDNLGQVVEFDPPKEDVLTFCCNLTEELLTNLESFLKRERSNIPILENLDPESLGQAILESDFIPKEIKKMVKANRASIEDSLKGIKIDYAQQALDVIASVKEIVAQARA